MNLNEKMLTMCRNKCMHMHEFVSKFYLNDFSQQQQRDYLVIW
jgi:hypothetical protein